MTRTTIERQNRKIFGARFSEQFQKWKREGEGRTQTSFGKLFDPPASRGSVMKWCNGDNIPSPDRLKRICEIFEVPEDHFDTKNATHDELYKHSSAFMSDLGKELVEYAKEKGLDLELVRVLSKIIDFDNLFPVYAPINDSKITGFFEREYKRSENMDSAPFDDDLHFLQVNQDGRLITFSTIDLIFLKEVQDQIVDFVEYLLYKRKKEMDEEVQSFNDDLTIKGTTPDGGSMILHKALTKEFILEHDRFAKYLTFEKEKDQKEGQ